MLWCLMFPLSIVYVTQSKTQTKHKDTTVGRVVSVESVHVDPAETGPQALSALTHRDILGTCYAGLWRPEDWRKIKKTALGQAVIW